jgi:hypothetical protein
MIDPPRWSLDQLEKDRAEAIKNFREERLIEPLDAYAEAFEQYQGRVEDLLETTIDLTIFDPKVGADVVTNEEMLEVFRYVSGPPISEDDLKTLVAATSLSPKSLNGLPAIVEQIVEVVMAGIDRRRFPWVREKREPTEAEKKTSVIATAALIATQRVQTLRRSEGKEKQEGLVQRSLMETGFMKVLRREIPNIVYYAPKPGEFCPESVLGTRKADFVIGLWDGRTMPVECKVSNSALNSVKRLNNDAAAKAEAWIKDFGSKNVVPVALLSGVYNLHNLEEAQQRGLVVDAWYRDGKWKEKVHGTKEEKGCRSRCNRIKKEASEELAYGDTSVSDKLERTNMTKPERAKRPTKPERAKRPTENSTSARVEALAKKEAAVDNVAPPLPPMPTLDKHRANFKEVRAILHFLEWLEDQGLIVCSFSEGNRDNYNPIMERQENLALRYLEIDPVKLEEDRRKLLDWQDEQYGKVDPPRKSV